MQAPAQRHASFSNRWIALADGRRLARCGAMSFFYFAFGSNMLPTRLQRRCASARFVDCAKAAGFDVEFSKVSRDGSGKATLVRAEHAVTLGALFEIADSDRNALDEAEGAGAGYDRDDHFGVELAGTGESMPATTYIATAIDRRLKPYDWYLALVIAGARHHGLDEDYLTRLHAFAHTVDPRDDRGSRLDALAALQAHGFPDYRSLLGRSR